MGDPGDPSEWVAASLLRIAQEALVNVYRHSLASAVETRLEYRTDHINLSVIDNGIGIPPEGLIYGVGLLGMSHRIAELGGVLKVSNLKHGTKVKATVRDSH